MNIGSRSEEPAVRWVPVANVLQGHRRVDGRAPVIVAVDGRSSAGKSTLAERLSASLPACAVVHTDDVAWNHSRFDWDGPLRELIDQVKRGSGVNYRPPPWDAHQRPGSIEIPAGAEWLIVEGVGVGRASLAPYRDMLIWVDTEPAEAERRSQSRIGRPGGPASAQHLAAWMSEEVPFLDTDRPWERADLIVRDQRTVPNWTDEVLIVAGPDNPPPRHGRLRS